MNLHSKSKAELWKLLEHHLSVLEDIAVVLEECYRHELTHHESAVLDVLETDVAFHLRKVTADNPK